MVLSHIAETAFVIVPIAAETAVDTMRMVRFHRGWTKPHVIVQNFRNRMRLQIRTTAPHFDFEACRAVTRIQADGQRTAQKAAHDQLAHEPADAQIAAAPCVRLIDDAASFNGFDQRLAFRKCMRRRLFRINIEACFCGRDGDLRMPVGRRRNMDCIDVLPFQHFTPIGIRRYLSARLALRVLQMVLIDVADGQRLGVFRHMAHAHAARTDDCAGDHVARCRRPAEHITARHNQHARSARRASTQEITPRHAAFRLFL